MIVLHRPEYFAGLILLFLLCGCSHDQQLLSTIEKQDLQQVQSLVDRGADVNRSFEEGVSPLMYASLLPNVAIVQVLIDAGADVNAQDADGLTPLMYAIHSETVRILVGAGADVNHRDHRGRTSLMSAQNVESARLMLNAGADPDAADDDGRTIFDRYTARMVEEVRQIIRE